MNVLPDGANRYRLTSDDGRELGWIRGRAVKVLGMASADHVMSMAQRAWRALQSVLRAEIPGQQREREMSRRLRLTRDAGYEWMSDGAIPLARLWHSPGDAGRQASFTIEFVVPANAPDRLAITAARAIAQAVDPTAGGASPATQSIP